MRMKAPLATLALGCALTACAGGQARPAGPSPVVVVGESVAPKAKDAQKEGPQLVRQQALEDAAQSGIIGLLGGSEDSDELDGVEGGVEGGVLGGILGGRTTTMGGPVGVIGSGSGSGGFGGLGVGGGGRGEGLSAELIGPLRPGSGAGSAFGYGGLGVRGGGPRAKVRFDGATVTGSLPAEVVQRVAGEHAQDVEDCYLLEAARDAHPRGRITLAITIDGQGSVTEVRVPETTLWTRDLPSCVAQAIGAWKFPPPAAGGEVKVILPVNL